MILLVYDTAEILLGFLGNLVSPAYVVSSFSASRILKNSKLNPMRPA